MVSPGLGGHNGSDHGVRSPFRYRGAMARSVTLSSASLLALGGGTAWLVGSSALATGVGTVVLAAGLAVTIWLTVTGGRHGLEQPLERWRSRRLLRLALLGVALVVGASVLLGLLSYGELGVPVAFFLIGALLVPASSTLGDRSWLLLGAVLMVLAALGGLLALNSAGALYPRGLVGLGSGLLLWAASAHRAGLLRGISQLR